MCCSLCPYRNVACTYVLDLPPWSFPSSKSCYLVIVMNLKIEVQWMLNNFTHSFFLFIAQAWDPGDHDILLLTRDSREGYKEWVLMLFCWMLIVNLGLTLPKKKVCNFELWTTVSMGSMAQWKPHVTYSPRVNCKDQIPILSPIWMRYDRRIQSLLIICLNFS
jgi:hypothetical protein